MFFLFLLMWILLNARCTVEVFLTGVALSGLLYLFVWKYLDYGPKREWKLIKRLPGVFKYLYHLVREIVSSNLAVMRFILSPKYEVEPVLVTFKTRLKSESARVTLANSITLTPGTITVELQDDTYQVLCLDKTMAQGVEGSAFERELEQLEGGN